MNQKFTLIFKQEIAIPTYLERVLLILFFSFLTFCGAVIKVYLPFTPVPFTLQNFILFLSIYYLNPKEVGFSQIIYVLLGLIGIPVFAVGLTGTLIFLGPTAGYIIGFIFSGIIMAFLFKKIKYNFYNVFLLYLFGALIILILGTLHIAFVYGLGLKKAITVGFLPFILTDTLKALIAASLYKIIK